MNAWVLNAIGDYVYKQVDTPVPGKGEVLLEVKAAGICGSDIPRAFKSGAHKMPLIIGHEFSGRVHSVGDGVSDSWKGKRVGIFPLIPCMDCPPCRKKQYEMCRHYNYLGSRCDGGFAQFVSVPEWNLIELPDSVSYEQAAMLEPMAVAVHATRRIPSLSDPLVKKQVVICGAGTIGTLMAMFLLKRDDIELLVIGNKENQLEQLIKLGLPKENYCNAAVEDPGAFVMDQTGGLGADVFMECVGKNDTMNLAIELTRPYGEICLVGNPYSDMSMDKNLYWKILRNQLHVYGTWNSSFTHEIADDWHFVLDTIAKGEVSPEGLISHRFKLEKLMEGFIIMRDKTQNYLKVMCVMDDE